MKSKKKLSEGNRNRHIHITLNEKEYAVICSYIKKYNIENRSRWFRETIISHILKNLEQDYPTLFGENEMRR